MNRFDQNPDSPAAPLVSNNINIPAISKSTLKKFSNEKKFTTETRSNETIAHQKNLWKIESDNAKLRLNSSNKSPIRITSLIEKLLSNSEYRNYINNKEKEKLKNQTHQGPRQYINQK